MRAAATALLLAGPFVLAFRSGGYFDEARLWAGIAACALVVAAMFVSPLPRSRPALAAIAGLAALTALTAASIAWAPLAGPAWADTQRLLLYLAALTAGTALFRPRAVARAVEPALAAGCTLVIGYAIADRLLPGLIEQVASQSAAGRLEQPLTYWNAVGAVAAIGLVLCTRLAGDGTRSRVLRAAAAAAAAPLGMGLYLTFSRGAIAAAVAGALVLVAVAPERRQLRALALAAVTAGLAAVLSELASLEGDPTAAQGALGLAGLALLCSAAAWGQWRLADGDDASRFAVPRRRLAAALLVGALALAIAGATVASETRPRSRSPETGATAKRLTSLESHRYAYWKVALGAFADEPLHGIGSGNFRVRWLREREFAESARDAHSLYLETAAELGLAGLLALGLLIAGAIAASRLVLHSDAALAAGPVAALAAWATQAGLDWLWEMPAVTLVALCLLALLLARGDAPAATRG